MSLHPGFYHGAHAAILVFDVTRKSTYKNLAVWYKELRQYRSKIPVLVLANKIDENPKSTEMQFNFAKKNNLEMNYSSGMTYISNKSL
jgi:Rab-like protein 2